MRKILIFAMIVFSLIVMFSCGGEESSIPEGSEDGSCYGNGTCDEGFVCEDGLCVEGDPGCPESNKFCHPHNGLDWSDASGKKMFTGEAVEYCENLGGRLPTISELRTLVQNCPATETGGECKVTDNCLSYDDCRNDACDGCEYDKDHSGKYSISGDNYYLWSSSSRLVSQSVDTSYVWFMNFCYGEVELNIPGHYLFDGAYVRCVRSD